MGHNTCKSMGRVLCVVRRKDVILLIIIITLNVAHIIYGLTTINKAKSGQVSTNKGIITQNIFNASVLTSVELTKIYKQAIIL